MDYATCCICTAIRCGREAVEAYIWYSIQKHARRHSKFSKTQKTVLENNFQIEPDIPCVPFPYPFLPLFSLLFIIAML